jgi:uncharacterized protein (DUF1778 family)
MSQSAAASAAVTLDHAPAEARRAAKDAHVNLRVSRSTRALINAAAEAVGQTMTEFVVASARARAIDVLLDQTVFSLTGKDSASFLAMLENPPEPNERLKELMTRKSPWEK